MNRRTLLQGALTSASSALLLPAATGTGARILSVLPPTPGNPRNTEGDFLQLKDGRILFAYTKFTGGGGDHDVAHIAARYSSDQGESWTTNDVTLLENEGGMNVMSVSLLRLRSGRIAFFYIRKNSDTHAGPVVRFSTDETRTWSDPVVVIPDQTYNVLNNDRVIQTRRGRLIAPVSLHTTPDSKWTNRGSARCYLSDDEGKTWRRSRSVLECPDPNSSSGLQEPGVVELKDGRLLMFCRTALGHQYFSYSSDGGDTWSEPQPGTLASPLSPASIERIPKTGDLLAVWNDHSAIAPELKGKRTPFTVAISKDEGRSWERKHTLLDDPKGWYCYTAIEFVRDRVLLGFASGGSDGLKNLSRTQIAWFPIDWLYSRA